MLREGLIDAEGTTRARVYRLKILAEFERAYLREGLQEDLVWRELIGPTLVQLPENVQHLVLRGHRDDQQRHRPLRCAGTFMFGGSQLNALETELRVADEGEGIFLKIQRAFGLLDPRESILELAKGKLTRGAPSTTRAKGFSSPRTHPWIPWRSNRTTCTSSTDSSVMMRSFSRHRTRREPVCGCGWLTTVRESCEKCTTPSLTQGIYVR